MNRSRVGSASGPTGLAGFTLIEMIVALTILSLIMLATVTGLRTLAGTQVAMERVTDRVDEVRSVSTFLRHTFESATIAGKGGRLSLGGVRSAGGNYFELTEKSVAWKATVLFGESFGGTYLVRVAQEGDQLVMRWQEPKTQKARDTAGDWEKAESRVLVEELEEFELSFRQSYSADWTDRVDRNQLPKLLRMQIKARGRYWPELVLRVGQAI